MKKVFGLALCFVFFISCKSTTETLIVGPSKVPCMGAAPQDCFQIKKNSTAAWENFYGTIEGFEYEPGYQYMLEVEVTQNENPPADGSSLKYTLKEIVHKKKTETTQGDLNGTYLINTFEDKNVVDKQMIITFNSKTGQMYGKGVCNRFNGTFVTNKGKIKFSQAATTRMLCKEPDLERDFFQKLNAVDGFKINDGQLTIMQDGKPVLTATLKKEE